MFDFLDFFTSDEAGTMEDKMTGNMLSDFLVDPTLKFYGEFLDTTDKGFVGYLKCNRHINILQRVERQPSIHDADRT